VYYHRLWLQQNAYRQITIGFDAKERAVNATTLRWTSLAALRAVWHEALPEEW